jgi:hypothetical protein
MNTTRLLVLLLIAAGPLTAFAQTTPTPAAASTGASPASTLPPAPPAADAAELTKLLHDFLAGASVNDATMHDRFWAEDLIYTGSSGRRIGKADIMKSVREESAPKEGEKAKEEEETAVYSAEDIRIQQYGTTAIVAFRLVGKTTKGGKTEVANYLNSGTFLKRDGKWQVVNWQATKLPEDGEQKK